MHSLAQMKSASYLDFNVANPEESPTDTVSSISWTPNGNTLIFATSDWASFIRIYNIDPDASTLTQQACFDAQSPCLCVKWHEDEKTVFAGCTDGSVKSYDVVSGNCSVIGKHEGPVKSAHWLSSSKTLLTLSFDKTVRFWDPRQIEPVAMHRLDHKVYCSDVVFPYLAIGLSDAKCMVVDLQKAEAELRNHESYLDSPLGRKAQITAIKLVSGEKFGLAISGNDGRCNISNFQTSGDGSLKLSSLMTFKCHQVDTIASGNSKQTLYPVNTIGFHPYHGSDFVYTSGGEGSMYFWDIKQKQKTVDFNFDELPVTQAEFDPTGKYMAYSLGYDWARGIQGYMSQPSKICVHRIQENELTYGYEGNSNYPLRYYSIGI